MFFSAFPSASKVIVETFQGKTEKYKEQGSRHAGTLATLAAPNCCSSRQNRLGKLSSYRVAARG